ncbi:MAG: hypothetical protein WBV82_26110 [Myxococcaceae bacterium]
MSRAHPAMTLLSDGRVLVAGGASGGSRTLSVESFDPTAGIWSLEQPLPNSPAQPNSDFSYPAAATLGDGRVLVMGASDLEAWFDGGNWLAGYLDRRVAPLLVSMPNGDALVAAGGDITWRQFSPGPSSRSGFLLELRYVARATALADGRALVVGGMRNFSTNVPARSAEIIDPLMGTTLFTGAPRVPRYDTAVARLADGRVLLIGGVAASTHSGGAHEPTSSVELYDPSTGLWRDTGFLLAPRAGHTATTLIDGRVVVVGGVDRARLRIPTVEVFDPATETWSPAAPLTTRRTDHVTALLADGRVLVAGGTDDSGTTRSTEIVSPGALCPAVACVGESEEELCARAGAACGSITATDRCGSTRHALCGTCSLPSSCGGAGTPNQCGVSQTGNFRIEIVDQSLRARPGLALDATGAPRIAYLWKARSGTGVTDLNLAMRLVSGWSMTPIRRDVQSDGVSLALDATGRPNALAIAYAQNSSKRLPLLVSWTNGQFVDETVPSNSLLNWYSPTLALGPGGEPHVCAFQLNASALVCLEMGASDWEGDLVDTVSSSSPPSAAVDANGGIHVAYYDPTQRQLVYSVRGASGWARQTVDASGNAGQFPSLALDAQGRPHIAYFDASTQALKHARWTGSAWSIESVHSGPIRRGIALALDLQGHPRIAFHNAAGNSLDLASSTGPAWNVETIDAAVGTDTEVSMAIDATGRLHVAYIDWTNSMLRYARNP